MNDKEIKITCPVCDKELSCLPFGVVTTNSHTNVPVTGKVECPENKENHFVVSGKCEPRMSEKLIPLALMIISLIGFVLALVWTFQGRFIGE